MAVGEGDDKKVEGKESGKKRSKKTTGKKGKRRGKAEYFRESMSLEMDEVVSYYPYSFLVIL